jgi:hypothetical protein
MADAVSPRHAQGMEATPGTGPSATSERATRRSLPDDDELLVRASELIARGWSRRALAEDRYGRQVEPWSATACRWSPLGALTCAWRERQGPGFDVFETAYAAVALATGGHVEEWNGARWRTKSHVLRAFSRARGFLPQARRQLGPL